MVRGRFVYGTWSVYGQYIVLKVATWNCLAILVGLVGHIVTNLAL